MKKELLKDENGKIRNCTSNVYKMNYFQLAIYDIRYLLPYELKDMMIELFKNLCYCFSCFLIITLMPVFIYLRVRSKKKRAIREHNDFTRENK
jgi:hypothetical protein